VLRWFSTMRQAAAAIQLGGAEIAFTDFSLLSL
jgi:hypothetical protein